MTVTIDITDQIYSAVAKLVSVYEDGGSVAVSLPVSYPSGAFTSIRVMRRPHGKFSVTDSSAGLQEAILANAGDFYSSCAKAAAEWFGIEYNGSDVLASDIDLSRIGGAASMVANASAMAVTRALTKAMETKEKSKNSELFEIVSKIFGEQSVSRTADISGKDAEWQVHNLVQLHGRKSVFEYVTKNHISLASTYMKFSDISQSDAPPSLISVVSALEAIGVKGGMLADVSAVMELRSQPNMYRQYARVH